jgi:hypothetical protein
MGSYAYLSLDDIGLYSTKNYVDLAVMMFYTEDDKRISLLSSRENIDEEIDEIKEGPQYDVRYVTTLDVIRDRLEFMGFNGSRLQKFFDDGLTAKKKDFDQNRALWENETSEIIRQFRKEQEEFLNTGSLQTWLDGFARIVSDRLYERTDDISIQNLPPLIRYMLTGFEEFYGFPTDDVRIFIRAVVEVIESNSYLTYEITDLVEAEYVEIEEDLCGTAKRYFTEEFILNHKIVVITEGSSDSQVLEGALRLLYPHLQNYYSFMDFDVAKVQGSASSLASTVKTFIGAGIVNRVIALFDNDTAAQVAMRALRDITIPNTVRVLRYPDIEIASNYPTLGPQGTINMNVNGLAGSLELYFGEDVLKTSEGNLTPIQWRGYDVALKQYQGEILDKNELQKRFFEKLRICQTNRELINNYDWKGIRSILEIIRTAFNG